MNADEFVEMKKRGNPLENLVKNINHLVVTSNEGTTLFTKKKHENHDESTMCFTKSKNNKILREIIKITSQKRIKLTIFL